jgi:hypothetical protein
MESLLQKELAKAGDSFMPRKYYIDKWGYRIKKSGEIDYSEHAEVQGPGINKKR